MTRETRPSLLISADVTAGGVRNNEVIAIKETTTHIACTGLLIDKEMISGALATKKATTDEENATIKA